MDVMFVNKVPFLVSASRNINLITIEHAPKHTASKLGHLLQQIVNFYTRAGLRVRTILMDNEFKKDREHIPSVDKNTPAAAEHIGEIERRIRYIKERARSILCTLPYPALPNLMLIQLFHFVVMWLNNFPSATGILTQYSPCELIHRHCLDYKKHCQAPFGTYWEAHEENTPTNSMLTRGTPSICLGPTGNRQGSYLFFSLVMDQIIKQRGLTEILVTQSVIDRVAHFARKSHSPVDLVFLNRHSQPFDWPEDKALEGDNTPIAPYPDIPAEMPGVHLDRSPQPPPSTPTPSTNNDPDWALMAKDAIANADLDHADHLPTPPDVIIIDDDDDNPLPTQTKQTLDYLPKFELDSLQPPHRYPSHH